MAIVAIARKLLVALWHILSGRVADRNAEPERVAFKLMVWSWRLSREQRGGLTSRQFVRYGLLRLGLGDDLTHILSGQRRCWPSVQSCEPAPDRGERKPRTPTAFCFVRACRRPSSALGGRGEVLPLAGATRKR